MITIKNLRKEKSLNAWDIRIDRANKILGNPFYLADANDSVKRDEVCKQYEDWFNKQLVSNNMFINELHRLLAIYKQYGKLNLFCWCAPKRCHGETIRAWLEAQMQTKQEPRILKNIVADITGLYN